MHVSKSEIPDDSSAIEREGFAVAVQRGEPPVGWEPGITTENITLSLTS
jgi:hypothetical protein